MRLLQQSANMDSEESRERLLKELLQDTLQGPTSRIMKANPAKLAMRELPPGTWSQIYNLYCAHCLAVKEEAASRSTFYKCTEDWRRALKFRRRSQHSICLTCDKIKSRMRHSSSFIEHAKRTDALLGHLAGTWRAREKYWAARAASRAKDDVLCIITDGFDKSKPCVPRWAHGRAPKHPTVEKHPRTALQLSACLAHGWGAVIFLAPEHVSTGGSFTWETVLLTMNEVWKQSTKEGRRFPRSLLCRIISDNV